MKRSAHLLVSCSTRVRASTRVVFVAVSALIGMLIAYCPSSMGRPNWGPPPYKFSQADDFDRFGSAVDTDGETVIVGFESANTEDLMGDPVLLDSGAATVFHAADDSGIFRFLEASDAASNDNFGASVSIDGNLVIVGAPGHEDTGDPTDNIGAAYVFDLETGDELFILQASDGRENDQFGNAVAIHGNLALVAAVGANSIDRGQVYVFDLETGAELRILRAEDAENFDGFGGSVALEGNTAVIGADSEDSDGDNLNGVAYIFDVETGEQRFRVKASDSRSNLHFGRNVDLAGNLAIIGVNGASAYVIDVRTGEEVHRLSSETAELSSSLGWDVGISESFAVAGAFRDDESGDLDADRGAAYVFDLATGEELYQYTADDGQEGDEFGKAVATGGDIAVVGAPNHDVGGMENGAIYVERIPTFVADAMIGSRRSLRKAKGDNRYNRSAAGQTSRLVSHRGRRERAFLRLQNDGNTEGTFGLRGRKGNRKFRIKYRAGGNVTGAVRRGAYRTLLGEGERELVKITVRPVKNRVRRVSRRRGRRQVRWLRANYNLMLRVWSIDMPKTEDACRVRVKHRP